MDRDVCRCGSERRKHAEEHLERCLCVNEKRNRHVTGSRGEEGGVKVERPVGTGGRSFQVWCLTRVSPKNEMKSVMLLVLRL